MNLTDLAEVLRERAESPDTPQDARLAGVRAKVTASKRRRAVAGAACVVLALVGLVYAVIPGPDVRRSPPRPRTLASISAEFPEPATGLSADPADPTRRKEITVEWPGPSVVHARVNTPGKLRVLVNDVPVVDFSHWTYTVGGPSVFCLTAGKAATGSSSRKVSSSGSP
jgi:hypothetical protein